MLMATAHSQLPIRRSNRRGPVQRTLSDLISSFSAHSSSTSSRRTRKPALRSSMRCSWTMATRLGRCTRRKRLGKRVYQLLIKATRLEAKLRRPRNLFS